MNILNLLGIINRGEQPQPPLNGIHRGLIARLSDMLSGSQLSPTATVEPPSAAEMSGVYTQPGVEQALRSGRAVSAVTVVEQQTRQVITHVGQTESFDD